MIAGYIDEAGTHDQAKIIVMAGFLSSYKRWRKFDRHWDDLLNPPTEANPPKDRRVFHATDCLGANGYGDFAGWSKDERDRLVGSLIPVARKGTLFAFSAAFALKDYAEIVPEWIRRKLKHPYYLCMFHIVNLLKISQPKFPFPSRGKIAFVFARKPKFEGLLTELYEDLRRTEAVGDILGKMTLGCPKEDSPLQAADLLCYLTRTFWEKEHYEPGSAAYRTQKLLRDLLSPGNTLEPHFLDREVLREFVRAYEKTHQAVGEWKWNSTKKKSSA